MTLNFSSLRARAAVAFAIAAMAVGTALAAYPDRPLRLVVPFAPGGGTDAIARALGTGMSQALGQPVIIDNKPGAGTIIGSDSVAKSPPDGYSLVVATFAHAVNPSLMPKLPFDTAKAFAPVVLLAKGPNILLVRAESPFKSVKDIVDAAKARPGRLTYASQGNGTSAHLAGEMFANLAKVNVTHVPYRGAAPAMNDLLGGVVDMMFATAAAAAPQVASGRLRALAVTSADRAPAFKALPTIAETVPGYAVESWYGLFAPAGTPADIIAKLNAVARQSAQTADFRAKIEPEGLTVTAGTPEELDAYVKREEIRWRRIVKENNIKAD